MAAAAASACCVELEAPAAAWRAYASMAARRSLVRVCKSAFICCSAPSSRCLWRASAAEASVSDLSAK